MKITIIGFGTMGRAMHQSLSGKRYADMKISVIDRRAKKFSVEKGYIPVSTADVVIVAVKPKDIPALADRIASLLLPKSIVISIAAGVSLKTLVRLFRHERIVRAMPNLGLSVGAGVGVWNASKGLSRADMKAVKIILDRVMDNFEVKKESLIDSVTAISGSGPAYFFYLADSLLKTAQELGIPKAMSVALVQKTLSASAALQLQGSYSDLIERVASKKGTTEAALKVFASDKMDAIIRKAVRAAERRAKEISHE